MDQQTLSMIVIVKSKTEVNDQGLESEKPERFGLSKLDLYPSSLQIKRSLFWYVLLFWLQRRQASARR